MKIQESHGQSYSEFALCACEHPHARSYNKVLSRKIRCSSTEIHLDAAGVRAMYSPYFLIYLQSDYFLYG